MQAAIMITLPSMLEERELSGSEDVVGYLEGGEKTHIVQVVWLIDVSVRQTRSAWNSSCRNHRACKCSPAIPSPT